MVYFSQVITPLVRTPLPFHGESVRGFVLRSSEVNGYQSPLKLLNYAGMDDEEARSARPPLDKLARLYGRTAEDLRLLGLDGNESFKKGRRLSLMGHDIPTMFMRAKHSGICVQCIKKEGYIEAFGELKYALVCPHHGMKMLHKCPSCKKPISWQRIGLLRCSCGSDLSINQATELENPPIILLMKILYAKLMKEPLDEAEMTLQGFPLEAIQVMSLETLLSLIYRFGAFCRDKAESDEMQQFAAISTTSEILSDWPHRFHDYLAKVHAPNANLKVSGLRGQFNSFYESFFKNIEQCQELQFMRDAFVAFGQQHWQQAAIHPKLSTRVASQTMGMNQLAACLGVQPSTLRKMIEEKVINVELNELNATRKLVKLAEQQPFEFASGRRLGLKEVAQQLDIPVEVMRSYRSHGYYEARHFAPMHMFHEHDVDALQKRLMQGMQFKVQFLISRHHVTLSQIMRLKISSEMKAMWLNAVSKRQIVAVGTATELPSGLVFDSRNVKSYLENIRHALQDTLSLNEVQSELKIDRATLFALIKHEFLERVYLQGLGLRITENSFNHFNNNMIDCRAVALLKNVMQKTLLALCKQMRIPVIQIRSSSHRSSVTCWIPRAKLYLLGVGVDAQRLLAA